MQTAQQTQQEFASKAYVLVRQLVAPQDREHLFQHALERAQTATMKADRLVEGTPAAYADPYMEDLLERLRPAVEEITRLKLFPTYSYFRVYKRGDVLSRHQDRMSCEISVTASLGGVASSPWPIWIEGPQGATPVSMEPGDGAIYRGIECAHWREPFDGDLAAQVFLHYVDQHGPHAEWKFDKRKRLGTIPHSVHIADGKEFKLHPDGVLEPGSGEKISLYPIEAAVWKHLAAGRTVPQIIEEVMRDFSFSRCEAEVYVTQFISFGEKESLLETS